MDVIERFVPRNLSTCAKTLVRSIGATELLLITPALDPAINDFIDAISAS